MELALVVLVFVAITLGDPRRGLATTTSPSPPRFDLHHYENYTVQQGATAFLTCVIKNLGNESVSWIRYEDSHILTVDEEVFISDPRISTTKEDETSFTLQIRSVSPADDGRYECQVSTVPKLSHFVHLIVKVPKVRILGDRDLFVKSQSTVHLKCVVSQTSEPPMYIEWLRDGSRISNANKRDDFTRVQVSPAEVVAEGTAMTTLTIWTAVAGDSGQYACWPAGQLNNATVSLHVVDNNPAELQTGSANGLMVLNTLVAIATIILHFTIHFQ